MSIPPSRGIPGILMAAFLALALAPPAHAAETPKACPGKPMRVLRSIGPASEYLGTYPGIPDLCHMSVGGQDGYFYLGVWRSDWPGAGDAYPALKTVVAGPPGTSASFVTRSIPGMQWTDTITNGGSERIVVGGRTHRVVKVVHERAGIEGNTYHSVITVWRDIDTGAGLRVVEDQLSGQSYGPATTWNVVGVEFMPQ